MQADRPLKKAKKKRPIREADGAVTTPEEVEDKGIKPRADAPLPETRPASIGGAFTRWLDAPQPVLRLELIRILAPLATLGFMSSRLAHTDEWLTAVGFQVPEIPGGDWRQPLYLSPLSTSMALALAALLVASGLSLAAGFKSRISALIFALTLAYVALADRLAAFTVSKLSPTVMLALAASPIGSRFSVDAWLAKRRAPQTILPTLVAGGGVRFFQCLLPVFYFSSAYAKTRGDWLTHKLVLWTHVHDSYQTGFSWVLANALPAFLWTFFQYLVYALELGAPVWFSLRRTRPIALLLAVGMHVMIGLMFWPVRWFSLLMISMWLGAFLPEAWLMRWASRVKAA
ncbi:Hypothetical protein A7982_10177 [Minicystis rosea]|nr:Hypothetical protein A7982_10177 [Minicystis rosea]